jgi:hypothetical protein
MNNNKFIALLIGECWHELIPYCDTKGMFKCKICEIEKPITEFWNPNPDHLSNPIPVIQWMKKEMPKVLDDYLYWCFQRPRESSLSDDIFFILDLSNLVTYLSEHREWGVRHCSHCKRGEVQMHYTHPCEQCGGIGGKHPALVYLEESCEK